MAAMSDEEFTTVWERHFPKLFRYCQFRSASVADAEDLAAETFSRLLAHGPMTEPHVLPWLYRVATNLNIDRWRLTKREAPLGKTEDLACQEQQWPDPTVWNAVRQLKSRQQLVVYLRLIEDRSFAEIGLASGRSEAAAKMIYHRALARLGALLGEDDQ
jgi:RNA polymerase sigma-70 factor (ECF subfamily)